MITDWLRSLLHLVYPSRCAVCSAQLNQGEHTICTHCRWDMPLTDYWSVFENPVVDKLAGKIPFVHASALMFFRHESQYREMIHRIKYGSRPDIAIMLGEIYGRYLSQSDIYKKVELIVPIPLHYSKRMKRGYNQSEEFARGIARSMGIKVEIRAVKRIRKTKTQAKIKSDSQRVSNVSGAFRITSSDRLNGRNILLIDDVLTTGATIESCAEAIVNSCPDCKLWIGALATTQSAKKKEKYL